VRPPWPVGAQEHGAPSAKKVGQDAPTAFVLGVVHSDSQLFGRMAELSRNRRGDLALLAAVRGRLLPGGIVMSSHVGRLPSRFPVGTRYVIEGRLRVHARYIEFPDGRHVDLPVDLAKRTRSRRRRASRRTRSRK
jgi:hypothetical protein